MPHNMRMPTWEELSSVEGFRKYNCVLDPENVFDTHDLVRNDRTIEMEIRRTGRLRRRYEVWGDGELIHEDIRPGELLPHLEWGISWRVVVGCEKYVRVHAASMVRKTEGKE